MKYSAQVHRFSIAVHDDAEDDIDKLWENDEDSAALIVTFLDEARNNQSLLENLSRNGFTEYGDLPFNVKLWADQAKRKRNLWRVEILSLPSSGSKLRIVYAFDPSKLRYYVLAVVPHDKNFDYESHDPITKRIIAAYQELEIPEY